MNIVRCESCDREIDENDAGMGYCFGGRAEYLCKKCCPPRDAETIIASIKTFMGFSEDAKFQRIEKEHFGDAEKKTGIYSNPSPNGDEESK